MLTFQYSNISIFQHFNIPTFQYLNGGCACLLAAVEFFVLGGNLAFIKEIFYTSHIMCI